MTKASNKIFWSIMFIGLVIAASGIYKNTMIKNEAVYIFSKITNVSFANKSYIDYEFFYLNKDYSGHFNTSGKSYKVNDFYMIKFQKSNPNNNRPIFNKNSWRCKLSDSSYYKGSVIRPSCEY